MCRPTWDSENVIRSRCSPSWNVSPETRFVKSFFHPTSLRIKGGWLCSIYRRKEKAEHGAGLARCPPSQQCSGNCRLPGYSPGKGWWNLRFFFVTRLNETTQLRERSDIPAIVALFPFKLSPFTIRRFLTFGSKVYTSKWNWNHDFKGSYCEEHFCQDSLTNHFHLGSVWNAFSWISRE